MEIRIKHYRQKAELTVARLAETVGWKQSRLSNYEQGLRAPGLVECRLIVAALNHHGQNITLDDVFPTYEQAS